MGMNVALPGEWIVLMANAFMLVGLRVLGLFLSAPMLSYRAVPLRLRLLVALVIALAITPTMVPQIDAVGLKPATFLNAIVELVIGMTMGFVLRIGLSAVDLCAEVLATQTGLSFASSMVHDPSLASGLMSEFLGLLALALTFALNLHLVLIDMLIRSFQVLPFGVWPASWQIQGVLGLMTQAFQLGLVLAMPAIVVYMLFYVIQALIGRTSPQLNLFAVGFAVTVPLAFFVLAILLPDFPSFIQRALEAPFGWIRYGLESGVAR